MCLFMYLYMCVCHGQGMIFIWHMDYGMVIGSILSIPWMDWWQSTDIANLPRVQNSDHGHMVTCSYIYIVLHMYIYIIYIYIMICMLCTYSLPDPLFAVPTFLTPASHPSKPEGAADAAKTRRRARRGDQPGNSQACETPVPQEYVWFRLQALNLDPWILAAVSFPWHVMSLVLAFLHLLVGLRWRFI